MKKLGPAGNMQKKYVMVKVEATLNNTFQIFSVTQKELRFSFNTLDTLKSDEMYPEMLIIFFTVVDVIKRSDNSYCC